MLNISQQDVICFCFGLGLCACQIKSNKNDMNPYEAGNLYETVASPVRPQCRGSTYCLCGQNMGVRETHPVKKSKSFIALWLAGVGKIIFPPL